MRRSVNWPHALSTVSHYASRSSTQKYNGPVRGLDKGCLPPIIERIVAYWAIMSKTGRRVELAHPRPGLMLGFHQSETCEGIIQHLEERERAMRCDVRVRDIGN